MAREKTYSSTSVFDGDEVSYSGNNDMERLREIESETVKTQNGKIGLAGLMAMGAALGLIATGVLSTLTGFAGFEFWGVLHALFLSVGMVSAIYGTVKTLLTLRGKTLNMPSLEVLRKNVAQAQPNVNVGAYNRNQTQNQTQNINPQNTVSQTLRRSRKSRVVAGVAGGLAEYMGISPVLVRIAFLMAIPVTSGFFPFIYLLLALVLPKNYDDWKTRK